MTAQTKKILIAAAVAAFLLLGMPGGASAAETIIINFEVGATGNPYLQAIPDTNGRWQIGYGSTWNYDANRWVRQGDTINTEQALRWLRNEVQEKKDLIDQIVTVPLTQNQKDSLVSLAYNIGTTAFTNSTLLQLLNSGAGLQAVADQFGMWVYAEGRILPGLVERRAREKALFLS
jgi:lysozyme